MKHKLLILLTFLGFFSSAFAQERKITPVDNDDNKPQQPTLHYYDIHGNPLKEPVLFLAELDTVQKPSSGPIYPKINGVSIGANFADAIFMLAGQKYASFDLWADLSIYNWFFPIVEAGAGFGKNTPEYGNFTYTSRPSFYIKAGLNYNLLYKSNPAYQVFAGLRVGYSSFSYDITNVALGSGYWGRQETIDLPTQYAQAVYGEVLGGIKVNLVGPLSMGWTVRYHFKLYTSSPPNSTPWFIPGYGATSPVTATLSLIYTLPIHSSTPNLPENGN